MYTALDWAHEPSHSMRLAYADIGLRRDRPDHELASWPFCARSPASSRVDSRDERLAPGLGPEDTRKGAYMRRVDYQRTLRPPVVRRERGERNDGTRPRDDGEKSTMCMPRHSASHPRRNGHTTRRPILFLFVCPFLFWECLVRIHTSSSPWRLRDELEARRDGGQLLLWRCQGFNCMVHWDRGFGEGKSVYVEGDYFVE